MTEFNPLDYDIYHLGVSGGKDSTAALLWLRYLSGWPSDRMAVSFCETENEDPLTYAYMAMLSELTQLPIQYVYPDCGSFWDLAKKKKRFPSRKARFCTERLKVIPSMRHIEELKKNGRVLILSGITKREGKSHNNRGNLEQFYHDDTYGCDKFLPIYDWTLSDIWAIHKQFIPLDCVHTLIDNDAELTAVPDPDRETLAQKLKRLIAQNNNIPCNPLYHMGATRVGCFPCINSAKLEIRAMAHWRPGKVDFIRTQEGQTGNETNNMYSTFFARNMTPPYWRSKTVTTAKGKDMQVATIDDVVAWSRTQFHKPKQFEISFLSFEGDDNNFLSCDMRGLCE